MIQEWFGVPSDGERNEDKQALDALLQMCKEAFCHYFKLEGAASLRELAESAKSLELGRGDKMFVEWIENKGVPAYAHIASASPPSGGNVKAHAEYEMYILGEEMDFQYPECVRSTLIMIAEYTPDIAACGVPVE